MAKSARKGFRSPKALAALAIVALVIATITVWRSAQYSDAVDTGDDRKTMSVPQGPKIVVLPFDNLSGNPQQDYFVDGLTEDLTTRLTKHGYLFVIARNSAFKYKGKSPDVRDVGRDLGVEYVVEGSVRRSADNIRVTAQLINAIDGTHVWAKEYDRELTIDGVFAIQDDLTIAISQEIGGTRGVITQAMLKQITGKRPKDLAMFECNLLHRSFWNSFDSTVHARARDCLERTVEVDPSYAPAWRDLSSLYRAEASRAVNPLPDPLGRAERAVNRALELDPLDPRSHLLRTQLMRGKGKFADARSSLNEAVKLSPSDPFTLHFIAIAAIFLGERELSWSTWRFVSQFDPTPPSWSYFTPVYYHHQSGDLEQALRYVLVLKGLIGDKFHRVHSIEASILADMGRLDEAREALSRALAMKPDFAKTARKEYEFLWAGVPEYLEVIMKGLYKAGLEPLSVETKR